MKRRRKSLPLFAGQGIEIEYALVDRDTLDVLPISDRVLAEVAGRWTGDVSDGDIGWSNELVLHQIELKTAGVPATLEGVAASFQRSLERIEAILADHGARLMPGGMHPWMDPAAQTRIWPHAYRKVYRTFDRIFDCRRHGWANVLSTHVNLPFDGEDEFARLHAAVRLVLPLLPALAASSPVVGGRVTGQLDSRLEHYRTNSTKVPACAGAVIPEPVFSTEAYETEILGRIYADLAPHDPEGTLRHEWANARGAIARFDRSAIEIRVLDTQECPRADIAVAAAVIAAVKAQVAERWTPLDAQMRWPVAPLARILAAAIERGPGAPIDDRAFLAAWGLDRDRASAGDVWRHLVEALLDEGGAGADVLAPLHLILERGTLAQRILRALGPEPAREQLVAVYRSLCDCLRAGRSFDVT